MSQLLGPYRLEAELGRGGMGVVWRAHDPALERSVAIKVVLAGLSGPEEVARLRREALAQARLRHPAIAGVHAIGTTPTGQPYLVMDLIEGESLHERLRRDGPLPPTEAARLVAELARAVHYAHSRGVLHRDLKARNVLVDAAGQPVVIDFGLAALTGRERLTATGEAVGTPGCMAPEQAEGDRSRVGPKADVYGLGAVLHEALTGRPPFVGPTVVATLASVLEAPAAPPSRLRPGLDPRLDAIVLRCLEKDPARRYPTAEALAEALEALAPRGPRPAPAGPRRGLRPLAGLLVGLVAGGVGAGLLGRPAPPLPAVPVAAETSASPTVAPTQGASAVARLRSRDYAGAQALAAQALASPAAGDLAQALVVRATVQRPEGALERSLVDLDAAAALDRSPSVLAQRAALRLLLGRLDDAREDLAELRRSSDPRVLVFAALGLLFAGDPSCVEAADAAVAATEELARDGRTPEERRLRAEALGLRAFARLGADETALADVDAAAARAIGPETFALLATRAPPAERAALLDQAVEAARERADALLLVSALYVRALEATTGGKGAGGLRRALADLDRAAALAPGSRSVLLLRARSRLALAADATGAARVEQVEAALRDAERAEAIEGGVEASELVALLATDLAFDPDRGVSRDRAAQAVAALSRGLLRTPHPQLLADRAELRANLGDFAGAELDARAVLESSPPEHRGSPIASQARAVLVRLRWRRGAVRDALALLDDAPPSRSPSPHLLIERAMCLALLRQPDQALAAARQALTLADTGRAHLALSRAHVAAGSFQAAWDELREALRRDAGLAVALADRAALRPEREADQALADLQAAMRLEPWAQEHRVGLALRLAVRDQGRAERELDQALALDPACCVGRVNRGRWRLVLHDDARGALGDLAFVCERQPWIPEPWALLGQARHRLGDGAGALLAAEGCLALLGERPTGSVAACAHRVRAAVLHDRRQRDGALEAAEQALAADPDDPEGLPLRAQLRAAKGDTDGALADLDQALARRPRLWRARLERAAIRLLRKEPAAARADAQAVVDGAPDPALVQRARELITKAGP